jgi:hypothetical protein
MLAIRRRLSALLVAAVLLAAAAPLAAQGTAPVPLDDPAYVYLDRLEELGVMDAAVMGQRPYSYREMARLTRAARAADLARRSDPAEHALVDDLLTRLEARGVLWPSLTAALLDDGLLVANANDAVRERPTPGGSNSSPQATTDPLALRRLGGPAVRGASAAAELLQRAEPLSWLAVNARERIEARSPDEPVPSSASSVLAAGGRLRWRNVALMAGREQLGWGSGGRGGLFLAADAPALDQISLASDHPFILPGLLRGIGPVSGTFVIADLGPSAVRSNSKMLAYKVSARPAATLELGATFQDHYGGEGGRSSRFFNRLIDFLPMIDIFRRHNYVDSTHTLDVDSDKALGVDARWRIDRLGGVIVAGEMLIDDFDVQRLVSLFNWAASHTLTITVPRLASPAWSLQLSATHMSPLTYTHAALRQGMTTRDRLLGNELGPDAKSFGAEVRWMPGAAVRLSLEGRSSIYSTSGYGAGYNDNGRWVVHKLIEGTDELREMAVGTLALEPTPRAGVTLRGGVERTRNVMVVGGRRHTYTADVGVRWRP